MTYTYEEATRLASRIEATGKSGYITWERGVISIYIIPNGTRIGSYYGDVDHQRIIIGEVEE